MKDTKRIMKQRKKQLEEKSKENIKILNRLQGRSLAGEAEAFRHCLTLQGITLWHHYYCPGWAWQCPQKLPWVIALRIIRWHCKVQHVGTKTSAVCFASERTWSLCRQSSNTHVSPGKGVQALLSQGRGLLVTCRPLREGLSMQICMYMCICTHWGWEMGTFWNLL